MKKAFPVALIVASLILNVVFISSWAGYVIQRRRFTGTVPYCAFNASTPHPRYRSLGISDQQWQMIQPALVRFSDSSKYLNDSIEACRATIIELLAEDSVDMESITEVQNSILRMQHTLQMLVINQLVSEKQILTPKQRQDLFLLLRSGCSPYRSGLLSDSTGGVFRMRDSCPMNRAD